MNQEKSLKDKKLLLELKYKEQFRILKKEISKLYGDNYYIINLQNSKFYTCNSIGVFNKNELNDIIPRKIKNKNIVIIIDLVKSKLDIISVHQPIQTKLFIPPIIM